MKKRGYAMLLTAGLLTGSLAIAQGGAQQPVPRSGGEAAAQPQAGCPCGQMMGGGMMGGHGMGGSGMSCQMMGMADVELEQTPTGAVLRLTAKDPSQVDKVQLMAQMMERCLEGGQQQP